MRPWERKFSALVRTHWDYACAEMSINLVNQAVVEDAVQEVLIKLWKYDQLPDILSRSDEVGVLRVFRTLLRRNICWKARDINLSMDARTAREARYVQLEVSSRPVRQECADPDGEVVLQDYGAWDQEVDFIELKRIAAKWSNLPA